MSLLARIEAFYLSLLRIVILAGATIALAIVAVSVVRSAPLFIQMSIPTTKTANIEGAGLADFIRAQRENGVSLTAIPAANSELRELPVDIAAAINLLSAYYRSRLHQNLDQSGARTYFMMRYESFYGDEGDRYASSLKSLMKELSVSTGTPLNSNQLNLLIDWHLEQFREVIAREQITRTASAAEAMRSLTLAGASLLGFLLIVFCFIFVKIERNLRILQPGYHSLEIENTPPSTAISAT